MPFLRDGILSQAARPLFWALTREVTVLVFPGMNSSVQPSVMVTDGADYCGDWLNPREMLVSRADHLPFFRFVFHSLSDFPKS